MKKLFFILLVFVSAASSAQTVTTFILVRHAEKGTDDPRDPDLSDAGKQRAQVLANLLKETKVDAIYSTPYKRTKNTVGPLAQAKNVEVGSMGVKMEEVDAILKKHEGGTIVIAGHSNTIPGVANYLTGTQDYKNFDDSDYDNLLIVTVIEKGKNTKVVWLSY